MTAPAPAPPARPRRRRAAGGRIAPVPADRTVPDIVDVWGYDSFPASDAPANWWRAPHPHNESRQEEDMTKSSSQFTGSIGTVSEKGIPDEVDVAIVGSGGAGLMAALTAAKEGARVLVVESRELVGGATGISAGAAWIPNHGFSTKELKVERRPGPGPALHLRRGSGPDPRPRPGGEVPGDRPPGRPVHRRAHLLRVDPDDLAGLPLRHRRRVRSAGPSSPAPTPPRDWARPQVRPTGPDHRHGQEPAPVLAAGRHRHRRRLARRTGTGRSPARGRPAQRCRRTRRGARGPAHHR